MSLTRHPIQMTLLHHVPLSTWPLQTPQKRTVVHKKSPEVYPKSPTVYQKSPIVYQKNSIVDQKSLHSLKRGSISKEPDSLHKEPYGLYKEPYTLSKEPCSLSKEPDSQHKDVAAFKVHVWIWLPVAYVNRATVCETNCKLPPRGALYSRALLLLLVSQRLLQLLPCLHSNSRVSTELYVCVFVYMRVCVYGCMYVWVWKYVSAESLLQLLPCLQRNSKVIAELFVCTYVYMCIYIMYTCIYVHK